MSTKRILVTPGDGIGPEVSEQAILVLKYIAPRSFLDIANDNHILVKLCYVIFPLPSIIYDLEFASM